MRRAAKWGLEKRRWGGPLPEAVCPTCDHTGGPWFWGRQSTAKSRGQRVRLDLRRNFPQKGPLGESSGPTGSELPVTRVNKQE